MNNLYIVSLSLTVFFLLLLVTKRHRQVHDFVLAFWLVLVSVTFLAFYFEASGSVNGWIEAGSCIVFLQGVVLWLYARTIIHGWVWKPVLLLHLIPFGLHLAMVFPALVEGRVAELSESFRNALTLGKIISLTVYLELIVLELRQHRRNLSDRFSNVEKITLDWLRFIAVCMLVLLIIGTGSQLLKLTGVPLFVEREDLVLNISFSIIIIAIGYYGFRQTAFFHPGSFVEQDAKPRYQKSGLPPEMVQSYYSRLGVLMKEQHLYRKQNLTLDDLALALSVTPNQLSQVINTHNITFYDLVNGCRIDEVKQRLINGDATRQTIESIAFECGFTSKATFNRIFRNTTGKTPTQFLKSGSG